MPKFKKRFKKQLGFVNILIVALIIGLGLLLSGAFLKPSDIQYKDNPDATATPAPLAGDPVTVAPNKSGTNLELQTLSFSSPSPSKTCQVEGLVTNGCSCPNQIWAGNPPIETNVPEEVCGPNNDCKFAQACAKCGWNNTNCIVPPDLIGQSINPNLQTPTGLSCPDLQYRLSSGATFCFGKPIIYLYPAKTTTVNVKLTIPGEIYISIPTYPTGGWKNVVAQPNGTLTYNNKTYSELYYESKVSVGNIVPTTGIVIPTNNLKTRLTDLTTQLGLKPSEQQEFLAYWLPKLNALDKPYILFSVLTTDQKESVDHVDISPKPTVFINFLVYFKGLDKPVEIKQFELAPTPQRSGFTAVEWGGTIDNN